MRSILALALLAACQAGHTSLDAPFPDVVDGMPDAADVCIPRHRPCANGDKCTVTGSLMSLARACVAATGNVAVGATCTGSAGIDDCADGLYCSVLGSTARTCHALCETATDCASGEACIALGSGLVPDGLCTATCAPFTAACGAQQSCAGAYYTTEVDMIAYVCRAVGATALGGACARDEDCVADALCSNAGPNGEFQCAAICDAGHPCATGHCIAQGIAGVCFQH